MTAALHARSTRSPLRGTVACVEPNNRYRRIARLGRGASAEVWRAEDLWLGRTVALRCALVTEGPGAERFLAQARVAARIVHPAVPTVFEVGWEEGRPYASMALVEGARLGAWLAGRPPARVIAERLLRVADAVAAGHEQGVVHGDLSPANVLVGDRGEVWVVDWGPERGRGTPGFAAADSGTAAGDVYALAALFRLALRDAPEAVDTVLRAAMSDDPSERPTASELLAELRAWLDDARARDRAELRVAEGRAALAAAAAAQRRAAGRMAEHAARAAELPACAPPEDRRVLWALEDEAAAAREEALLAEEAGLRALHAALAEDPECPGACAALADHHRLRQIDAERRGDLESARREERALRRFDRGAWAHWLEGSGWLSLDLPADAAVRIAPVVTEERRRVPGPWRSVGEGAIARMPLAMGSWILSLEAGTRRAVYPVHIRRLEHWDGVAPDGRSAVRIPVAPPDSCFVPAGWFEAGSREVAVRGAMRPMRVWIDDVHVETNPVTWRRYLAFLDAVDPSVATLHLPRYQGRPDAPGAAVVERGPEGHRLVPDQDGDVFDLDWPVMLVDIQDARAFAAWWSEKTGWAWRLPHELEWEKAARGVDGRIYPWGDHFEPSFCAHRNSGPRPLPARLHEFPVDESVYGVRHLAGNVIEFTETPWFDAGPPVGADGRLLPTPAEAAVRCARGGLWSGVAADCRVDVRWQATTSIRRIDMGFRLFCSPREESS